MEHTHCTPFALLYISHDDYCFYRFFVYLCRPIQSDLKMGRISIERRSILLGWVLLVQVLFHLCGSTLFIHSHIIDGHEIVHSHFFAGPVTEHSHTASSAESINHATYGEALVATEICATESSLCVVTDYTTKAEAVKVIYTTHFSLRAPPTVA